MRLAIILHNAKNLLENNDFDSCKAIEVAYDRYSRGIYTSTEYEEIAEAIAYGYVENTGGGVE